MIDKKLLVILRCPVSGGELKLSNDNKELICYTSELAYPIRNDIPIMLETEARRLTSDEKLNRE